MTFNLITFEEFNKLSEKEKKEYIEELEQNEKNYLNIMGEKIDLKSFYLKKEKKEN